MLNDFKVELVSIRENEAYDLQIFAGFDDEKYGATFRLVPNTQ